MSKFGRYGKYGAAATMTIALAMGVAGCNKQADNTAAQPAGQTPDQQQDPNYDPASANMAPADQSAPANESASSAGSSQPVSSSPKPSASSQSTSSESDN